MSTVSTVSEELIIEKDGKYWGIEYEDESCHQYGWVDDPEIALRFDPKFTTEPANAVAKPYRGEMGGANFVRIREETIFEVLAG